MCFHASNWARELLHLRGDFMKKKLICLFCASAIMLSAAVPALASVASSGYSYNFTVNQNKLGTSYGYKSDTTTYSDQYSQSGTTIASGDELVARVYDSNNYYPAGPPSYEIIPVYHYQLGLNSTYAKPGYLYLDIVGSTTTTETAKGIWYP